MNRLDAYHQELRWPGWLRAGDQGSVTLALDVEAGEQIFETDSLLAEAHLELAGVSVLPQGTVSQSVLPGQAVRFTWQVSAAQPGTYEGTAWLYLRFLPLNGGAARVQAISAPVIEIKVVRLLGLSAPVARLLGGAGCVLGSMLFLLDFYHRIRRQE